LLSCFKDVVDRCLVKAEAGGSGFPLGPELSKAFGKDEDTLWRLVETEELDSMFRPILDSKVPLFEPEEFDQEEICEDNDMLLQIS
jgi:hypothetical protein